MRRSVRAVGTGSWGSPVTKHGVDDWYVEYCKRYRSERSLAALTPRHVPLPAQPRAEHGGIEDGRPRESDSKGWHVVPLWMAAEPRHRPPSDHGHACEQQPAQHRKA